MKVLSAVLSCSLVGALLSPTLCPATPEAQEPTLVRRGALEPDPFLTQLFKVASEVPSPKARRALKAVLSDPERYHLQLLITELDPRTGDLTPHEYRVDQDYIYPASAIKTFASLASLMYAYELSQAEETRWFNPESPIAFHRSRCHKKDKSNIGLGVMTLGHEIRQTQLVSSNRAFNHVFDVVGSERLHEYLLPLFPSLRVYHRLSTNETHQETLTVPALTTCEARSSRGKVKKVTLRANPTLLSDHNAPTQASGPLTGYGPSQASFKVGVAYKDPKSNELIKKPMDFTWKNRVSFYDFQRLMFAIFKPDMTHEAFGVPIRLTSGPKVPTQWLNMLRAAMITYPHDSKDPQYKGRALSETRFKPLIRGVRMSSEQVNAQGEGEGLVADHNLYYMNKAGKALGFHLDNALIGVGPKRLTLNPDHTPKALRKAVYITIGLYVNQDQVLNDNRYEYSQLSVPLFDAIGYAIGRYLQE